MNDKSINWGGLSQYRNELYGFAIIWIMLFHSKNTLSYYPGILNTIINHSYGVEIFIFLSGVSLCYSKVKKNEPLSLYYCNRLKRVYVPLIFDIVYWMASLAIKKSTFAEFISNVLCIRFWLTGDQQIWFISAILMLYFIFPYLYSFMYGEGKTINCENSNRILLKTVGLILFLFVVFYVIQAETSVFFDNSIIALSRIPAFVLGIAYGSKVINKMRIDRQDYSIAIAMFIVGCFMCIARFGLKIKFFVDMPKYYLYFFMVPITMILLIFVVNIFRIRIVSQIFKWFGTISLELYIVHITLINVYMHSVPYKYEEGNILKYLGVIAISIVVAYLWHRVIAFSQKKLSGMLAHKKNI